MTTWKLVLLTIFMSGCITTTPPGVVGDAASDYPRDVPTTLEGFSLLIRTDKTEFEAVQPIALRTVLRNTGARAVTVVKQNPHVSYRVQVTYEKSRPVPLTRYGSQAAADRSGGRVSRLVLQPDETDVDVIMLNRLFDMSLPGTYRVTACRAVPGIGAPEQSETVISNAIEILVR